MWSFNQQNADNNNQGLGWSVNNANSGAPLQYGNQAQSNFGWNLGAPAHAAPPYPMPQPTSYPSYPSQSYNNQDDDPSEPGVEEEGLRKKDAGAGSFAHYIVKWVYVFT